MWSLGAVAPGVVLGAGVGVSAAFQLLFFLAALTLRTDVFTDFAGTSNFLLLFLMSYFFGGSGTGVFGPCARTAVVTGVAVAWGLRLGGFLLARILSWGKDNRFDKMREKPLQWGIFWGLQALWASLTSLPVSVLNMGEPVLSCQPLCALDWVAWALMITAIVVEATADFQKLRFKREQRNAGKWCTAGLWSFSRHPNYFAEMLFWWSAFAASCAGFKGSGVAPFLIAALGPLFTSLLLLGVSGVPLLEDSADSKHFDNAAYVDYKFTTSPVFPLPPRLYRGLPSWAKKWFLFEWDLYSRTLRSKENIMS